MADPSDQAHWSRVARDWIEWARRPGHDVFWHYRAGLASLIGPGTDEAIDVGCGEGRVSRLLRQLGYRVTATDAVAEMVEAAREAGSADAYAVAPATALPFEDGRFGLVAAYNMLMDVDDLAATVAEARRVLRPGGRMIVSIVHPLRDRGSFAGDDAGAPFAVDADWFATRHFSGREERDGLAMDFAGWSRPLEAYVAALAGAGLAITGLREPRPDPGPLPARLEQARRLPIFLWLVAEPRP
jgi:SAM-dependent methyltransferase